MKTSFQVLIACVLLSSAQAEFRAGSKPVPAARKASAPDCVFSHALDGNLVKLSGDSFKSFKDFRKPAKYYIFFYTASWCGPCHKFTPSLVDFYKKNKNDDFEIVLITCDSDEEAMEDYAKEMEMPWPQLTLSKARDFKKNFKHGVTGIPSVIVCDLDGKVLGNYRDLAALEKLVK